MIEIIAIFMDLLEEQWMALCYWDLLYFVKNIVFFCGRYFCKEVRVQDQPHRLFTVTFCLNVVS